MLTTRSFSALLFVSFAVGCAPVEVADERTASLTQVDATCEAPQERADTQRLPEGSGLELTTVVDTGQAVADGYGVRAWRIELSLERARGRTSTRIHFSDLHDAETFFEVYVSHDERRLYEGSMEGMIAGAVLEDAALEELITVATNELRDGTARPRLDGESPLGAVRFGDDVAGAREALSWACFFDFLEALAAVAASVAAVALTLKVCFVTGGAACGYALAALGPVEFGLMKEVTQWFCDCVMPDHPVCSCRPR